MIRIAIITDIHGNMYALNAVLNDMKNKSIDYVYCLGDMIGIGHQSNEVMDALLELDNISMITGNHDEAVLALLNNEAYPQSRVNVIPHHEWIAERLTKRNILELKNLPRIINPTIFEQNLHLIHYPMIQKLKKAHISEDPFDQTGMPSSDNFSTIDELTNFSLTCFGHDHSSHLIKFNDKTFFNPGSLGRNKEPLARYGIIEIGKEGFNIYQQVVPYNLDNFISELMKTNIPRKEIILAIYN